MEYGLSILGLAIAAFGAAWLWRILWIAILAGIIGAKATLETSRVVFGLTSGDKDLHLRP